MLVTVSARYSVILNARTQHIEKSTKKDTPTVAAVNVSRLSEFALASVYSGLSVL